MIDTAVHLETPEGIELSMSPAGPLVRGLALSLDLLIRSGFMIAIGMLLGVLGTAGAGIYLIAYFLLQWFYPVFFEVLSNGQTPGKRVMGLRTVNHDGTPVGWSASVLRNLLRTVDVMPIFYVGGVVTMLCNREFMRLGDLAAGTLVIHVHESDQRARPASSVEGAQAISLALRPEEQRAILSFAERAPELSEGRVVELAGVLQGLTHRSDAAGAAELLRIANGLAGKR